MRDVANRILKMLQLQNIFIRRTDCHDQFANWSRNDVGCKNLFDKQEIVIHSIKNAPGTVVPGERGSYYASLP